MPCGIGMKEKETGTGEWEKNQSTHTHTQQKNDTATVTHQHRSYLSRVLGTVLSPPATPYSVRAVMFRVDCHSSFSRSRSLQRLEDDDRNVPLVVHVHQVLVLIEPRYSVHTYYIASKRGIDAHSRDTLLGGRG